MFEPTDEEYCFNQLENEYSIQIKEDLKSLIKETEEEAENRYQVLINDIFRKENHDNPDLDLELLVCNKVLESKNWLLDSANSHFPFTLCKLNNINKTCNNVAWYILKERKTTGMDAWSVFHISHREKLIDSFYHQMVLGLTISINHLSRQLHLQSSILPDVPDIEQFIIAKSNDESQRLEGKLLIYKNQVEKLEAKILSLERVISDQNSEIEMHKISYSELSEHLVDQGDLLKDYAISVDLPNIRKLYDLLFDNNLINCHWNVAYPVKIHILPSRDFEYYLCKIRTNL